MRHHLILAVLTHGLFAGLKTNVIDIFFENIGIRFVSLDSL